MPPKKPKEDIISFRPPAKPRPRRLEKEEAEEEDYLICPQCGARNPVEHLHCKLCGRAIGTAAARGVPGQHTAAGQIALFLGFVALVIPLIGFFIGGVVGFGLIPMIIVAVCGAYAYYRENDSYGVVGFALAVVGDLIFIGSAAYWYDVLGSYGGELTGPYIALGGVMLVIMLAIFAFMPRKK